MIFTSEVNLLNRNNSDIGNTYNLYIDGILNKAEFLGYGVSSYAYKVKDSVFLLSNDDAKLVLAKTRVKDKHLPKIRFAGTYHFKYPNEESLSYVFKSPLYYKMTFYRGTEAGRAYWILDELSGLRLYDAALEIKDKLKNSFAYGYPRLAKSILKSVIKLEKILSKDYDTEFLHLDIHEGNILQDIHGNMILFDILD